MTDYTVNWQIDLEAETPKEAALEALRIQRNHESIATVFTVAADGKTVAVDLTMGDAYQVVEPHTALLNALKRLLKATEPGTWDNDPREETAAWIAAQEVVERFELRRVPELVPGGVS